MNAHPKVFTTMTSREFNQDRSKVKREAKKAPVVITERGMPTLVVMSIEEFESLKSLKGDHGQARLDAAKPFRSLADAIAQTDGGDFDFDIPEFKGMSLRPADLE